ncbi:MAG: hypothetical protein V8R75_00465 [Oscillospiraceae bacterium]
MATLTCSRPSLITRSEPTACKLYHPEEIILSLAPPRASLLDSPRFDGDEVIIPTPAFGLYESITRLLRGVPVSLPTEKNHFQLIRRPCAR